jgi:hypothetical protein
MTTLDTTPHTATDQAARWARWLPLGGLGYAIFTIAGSLVVDKVPDGSTSTASLARYYAAHHTQVGRGGQLMGLSVVFLGLFVVGLLLRARSVAATAAVIGVGGAAYVAAQEWSSGVYAQLGNMGAERGMSPEALQAWHFVGAEGSGLASSSIIFVLGIAIAALVDRTLPAWIGVTAVLLEAMTFLPQPFGFFSGMLMLLWAAVAGVTLAVRR